MDSTETREGRIREPLHDERGSTVARVIAIAALVAAVALAALAMFGNGDSYKVHAVFENAGQLVKGNEVRVGGQPIGTITDIELDDSAQAVVTMEVEDDLAPLHEGTTATIRATSLSGIANRYISLKPGANSEQRDRRRRADRHGQHERAGRPRRALQLARRQDARRACATWFAGRARSTTDAPRRRREHQVLRALPEQHHAS